MAKRQVFFSFHYGNDSWRAGQIRNMGKVDSGSTFSDNDWEIVKGKTEAEIKEWINEQLDKRSCVVVLIGNKTSERKWVKYEILRACEMNKGIVGVYIHKLENASVEQDVRGGNPFENIAVNNGNKISKYIRCFDSNYSNSKDVYNDIKEHIEDLIEYGIAHRPETW